MSNERGFTIIEVIIAVIVLTVGLLGLVSSAALTTRMIARGQRSAVAAAFAAQRMEQLRRAACQAQTNGVDTLYRGSQWVSYNTWTYTNLGNNTWQVRLVDTYKTAQGQARSDAFETEISCLF